MARVCRGKTGLHERRPPSQCSPVRHTRVAGQAAGPAVAAQGGSYGGQRRGRGACKAVFQVQQA